MQRLPRTHAGCENPAPASRISGPGGFIVAGAFCSRIEENGSWKLPLLCGGWYRTYFSRTEAAFASLHPTDLEALVLLNRFGDHPGNILEYAFTRFSVEDLAFAKGREVGPGLAGHGIVERDR